MLLDWILITAHEGTCLDFAVTSLLTLGSAEVLEKIPAGCWELQTVCQPHRLSGQRNFITDFFFLNTTWQSPFFYPVGLLQQVVEELLDFC